MKETSTKFREAGISFEDELAAMADHLVYVALAMGRPNNLSEQTVLAVIGRMENTLDDWKNGNHPFEDFNKNSNSKFN